VAEHPKLQARLNSDAEYREKFLKDPCAVLRAEGIKVTREQEESLNSFVQQASSAANALGNPNISVNAGIAISVRF
jgi:hypothetical protein